MPATIQCFIIRNDNADSVYQFVIELCLRCRVCVAELPDFIGAEIALSAKTGSYFENIPMFYLSTFSMSLACAISPKTCDSFIWQRHIGTNSAGKRNQLILMIMQRQKILE